MHPAASLILFTTLSGAGFGLMAMLGLGLAPVSGWAGMAGFAVAFALTGVGLSASTLHLGRPERALKAFREWRTSWLSREAWLAVATLGLAALYALLSLAGLWVLPLGCVVALSCLATVGATAMIYAQLATVPRWHHWSTPALFLLHATTAGVLLAGHAGPGAGLLIATGAAQFATWRRGDELTHLTTTGTATGLGPDARPFEAPHTGESYLTREMVFIVARRHRLRLRSVGLAAAYAAPLAWLILPGGAATTALAAVTHIAGTTVIRWLFFAEAEHVMARYYRQGS